MTRRNAEQNGFTNVEFRQADVFDLLTELYRAGGHPYDFIILDPPAFNKELQHRKGGGARLQGDKPQGNEAAAKGRLPCDLLMLALHD